MGGLRVLHLCGDLLVGVRASRLDAEPLRRSSTRNEVLGFAFPSSWFQSVNALFIIIFAPMFAWLWLKLGSKQPSAPLKFSIGLIGVGLGLIIVPAARLAAAARSFGRCGCSWCISRTPSPNCA